MDELEVFSTALEIDSTADRVRFLDEACGDNMALRGRVETLLASWQQAGDFLAYPARDLARLLTATTEASPDADAATAPQRMLGEFQLVRELGCGGMGVVYEARQRALGRRVALKVLPFLALVDPRQLQRFQNEARAAASLHHPNIVSVYSVGCDRGVHYYAMEYIEGQTLAQVIAELRASVVSADSLQAQMATLSPLTRNFLCGDSPPQSPPQDAAGDPVAIPATQPLTDIAASSSKRGNASRTYPSRGNIIGSRCFFRGIATLGIQAAEALEHAHQLGIVHRDIKPANLMVDGTGHLWITDFGLATGNTITGPTMTGDLLGTLRYMSPEQASGERQILDGRTDVYSLGATLYELVTLQPVYPTENRQELLGQIANMEPLPPHQLNPRTPRELETIILKAMAKEPASRYDSSRALADDLRRFLADEPIRARRPSLWERAGRWSRRHRPLVWSAASILIITTVLSLAGILLIARARQEAIRQREEVRRQEATLRRHLNVANMHWAWQAWHSGKLEQASEYLARQLPRPGEQVTRSFAWYYLWRLCHSPCQVLPSHSGAVYGLTFSPDGKTLVSGGADQKVIHWDVATWQQHACWEDFSDDVNGVRFSSDGRLIATAEEDHRVRIWDVASGRVVQSLTDFALPVATAFFSPDDTHLFASEVQWTDRLAHTSLWDLRSGQRETRFEARLFAMSPDRRAALLHRGLWNWTEEGERHAPSHLGGELTETPFTGVFLSEGATVAAGGMRHLISVQKLPGRETVTTLYGHTGIIRALDFSANANLLASGADDSTVLVWDTLTWDLQGVLPGGGTVWAVAFSPSGDHLAAGCGDGRIRIWDPSAGRAYISLAGKLPREHAVAFVSNDELVTTGFPTPSSWAFWDVETGRLLRSFDVPSETVERVAASPTESVLAFGISDGVVRVVDRALGKPQYDFPPNEPGRWWIKQLAFSPNGRLLAAVHARLASRPFLLRIWDVASGRPLLAQQFDVRGGWADGQPFAFSPDSQTLMVSFNNQLYRWEAGSGVLMPLPNSPIAAMQSVAYSPDGQWLALGAHDWSLRLISPRDPAVDRKLVGPRGLANALAFTPEGCVLVSGSTAGEVTLWDVETGEEILTLDGPGGPVSCLAISPDGTRVAATSEIPSGRYMVFIWHAPQTVDNSVTTASQDPTLSH